MMEKLGHHIYFLMYCISGWDGKVKKEEEDELMEHFCSQVFTLARKRHGFENWEDIPEHTKMELATEEETILEEARLFYEDCRVQPWEVMKNRLDNSVNALAGRFENEPETLAYLYKLMLNIAAADGEIIDGERSFLNIVKHAWGL